MFSRDGCASLPHASTQLCHVVSYKRVEVSLQLKSTIDSSMSVPNPTIASLIASTSGKSTDVVRVVSVADQIVQLLKADKLAYVMNAPPWMVGVHPANRGGYGCSGMMVHSLGAEIVAMGWSHEATSHALCVEDDDSGTIAKYTASLIESSPGLAPVPVEHIKYGSLSCTHTNQFLNAVNYGIASEEESLTVEGRISKTKLEEDTKLKEALEKGIAWLVLSRQVEAMYGHELLDLLSHARNRTGSAQVQDGEMQILVKVQKMVTQFSKNGQVDWQSISNCLLKRGSVNPTDLQVLMKFVQLYGGGSQGTFIDDLNRFHKSFVASGRIVPISTFSAINELKISPSELCPWFAIAIVKAQASCPANKTQNKVAKYLMPSDIAALSSAKKQQMLDAEAVLAKCRLLMDGHGDCIDEKLKYKMLYRLDTIVARIVLKKDMTQHSHAEQAGHAFCTELESALHACGKQSTIVSPWAASSSSSSGATEDKLEAQQKSQGSNVIEYDASGKAIGAERVSLQSTGCRQQRMQT